MLVCDDVVDGVEAEAGSLTGLLRGEERFEDALLDRGRDLRAVVLDLHHDAVVLQRRCHDDLPVVDARLADRICRVVDQVGPHLVEAAAMGGDPGKAGVEGTDHCDAGRLRLQDEEGVVDALRHVDILHGGLVEIGIRLEGGNEFAEALRSFRDLCHEIVDIEASGESFDDESGAGAVDHREIGRRVTGVDQHGSYLPCIRNGVPLQSRLQVVLHLGSINRTQDLTVSGRGGEFCVLGEGRIGGRSALDRRREERGASGHGSSRVVHLVREACCEHADLCHPLRLAEPGLLLAPPGDEDVEQRMHRLHVRLEEHVESRLRDRYEFGIDERSGGGVAWLPGEQRHLADDDPGSRYCDAHCLFGRDLEDLDLSGCHDVGGVPRIPLVEQRVPLGERARGDGRGQAVDGVIIESGEEFNGAQIEGAHTVSRYW